MKLHTHPASPFGRKVKVAAIEIGLFERLELANLQTSPLASDPGLVADNPLGKIPCLVLDDGSALYDSRVICEYLDTLHEGTRLFPEPMAGRWTALRRQALGDGIAEAALLARYETFLRPEELRWHGWVEAQLAKVRHAIDRLEAEAEELAGRIDIGAISLACALGYVDFRHPGLDWRHGHPALTAWFEVMAARASMTDTAPPA